MATYLRFTKDIYQDIEAGVSYLKTPSMKKAQRLDGLCAFPFDMYNEEGKLISQEEMVKKIKILANNQYYLDTDTAALVEGDYTGGNTNGEGVIIKNVSVLHILNL